MGDDFSEKPGQNDSDMIVFAFQLVAGDIADPDLVGPFRGGILVGDIPLVPQNVVIERPGETSRCVA